MAAAFAGALGAVRRRARLPRRLGAAAAVALLAFLAAPEAGAQTTGDAVHLETDAGPLDGTLVDRLPDGYLVRVDGKNRVVPYTNVKSITRVGAAPGPSPAPVPLGPAPAPLPPLPGGAPPPAAAPPLPAPPASIPPAAWPPAPVLQPPQYYPPGAGQPSLAGAKGQTMVAPATFVVEPKRPANAYTITGVTMVSVGLASVVAGAILVPAGVLVKAVDTCQDATQILVTYQCDLNHGGRLVGGGAAALIGGGLLALGGIPFLVVGDKKAKRPAGTGAASPALLASPGSAALRWRF